MMIRTETRPRLRGEFLFAMLLMVALAGILPGKAEAGVVVRAGIGPVTVVATSGGVVCRDPYVERHGRHQVITAGCNDSCCRPAHPRHGRFVWVPGHFEKQLVKEKWTRGHRAAKRHGKAFAKQVRYGKNKYQKKHRKRFVRVWVPGHWERY